MAEMQRAGWKSAALVAGSRRRIPQPVNRRSVLQLPSSFSDWLQVIGFLGAAVYFVFLYLYQQFYNSLDLAPEDVGLDRAAILVRAFGAVLLLVPIVMAITAIALFEISLRWTSDKLWHLYLQMVARRKKISPAELKMHIPPTYLKIEKWLSAPKVGKYLLGWIWIPTLDPTKSPAPFRSAITRRKVFRIAADAFLIGTVVSFIIALPYVHKAAAKAAHGEAVQPLRIGGLTLLDIKSLPCTVEWIGSGRPPNVLNERVNYLGRSGSVVYLRSADKTIALPANAVIVSIT